MIPGIGVDTDLDRLWTALKQQGEQTENVLGRFSEEYSHEYTQDRAERIEELLREIKRARDPNTYPVLAEAFAGLSRVETRS